MIVHALHAELIKIRTMRVMLVITAGALAVVGAYVIGSYGHAFEPVTYVGMLDDVEKGALFAVVAGITVMAGELRHRTLGASLLVIPDRARLLLAKAVAAGICGAVMGAFVSVVTFALVLTRAGAHMGLSMSQIIRPLVGSIIVYALFGILGVGFGALMRNQLVAVGWLWPGSCWGMGWWEITSRRRRLCCPKAALTSSPVLNLPTASAIIRCCLAWLSWPATSC